MHWKLKLLLEFVKIAQPTRQVDLEKIQNERTKNERVAELGKFIFDSKENVGKVKDDIFDSIPVRIYKKNRERNQKVILFFHGGGFCFYGIESHDNVARRLCQMNNCTVISVDYRLAPEHVFPSAQEDAYKIVNYVYDNAKDLDIDKKKIIVAGDSAGGTLSACVAHHFKNDKKIKIAAQVLIYPWVDGKVNSPSIEKYKEGYMLTKEGILWFQKTYTPNKKDRLNPEAAPTHHTDFSNLPPAFIATAEFDPLKDEGFVYAEKLKDAKNKVVYKDYEGLIHGFANIPNIAPNGMDLFKDIKQFLDATIK